MKRIHPLMTLTAGLFVGLLTGAALTTAHSDEAKTNYDQAVARVGDTTITRGQLAEYAIAQVGDKSLNEELLDMAIIEEAARKAGVTVTAEEVQQRVNDTFAFGAESEQATRRLQAVPRWLLTRRLRGVLLAEKMMNIAVTPNLVQTYYTENLSLFSHPARVRLVCISTTDKNNATRALNRLKNGEEPGKLSVEYSTVPFLKEAKGELPGWYTRSNMPPVLAIPIFDSNNGVGLAAKGYTDIIEQADPSGQTLYTIIYVAERQEGEVLKLDDIRDKVTYLARGSEYAKRAPAWFREQTAKLEWQRVNDLFAPQATLEKKAIDSARYGDPDAAAGAGKQ